MLQYVTGFVWTVLILSRSAIGQVVPLTTGDFKDYFRRNQLAGRVDSSVSFLLSPVYQSATLLETGLDSTSRTLKGSTKLFSLLPVSFASRYAGHHAYDWNDGPLIPSKGLQANIRGGVFLKKGPLSIQIYPELTWAANPRTHGIEENTTLVQYYERVYNRADLPGRFGSRSYARLSPGQSSVLLTAGPVAAGISTENIWWGPGVRNSLLMSNTAEGFGHVTLHTAKPLHTWVGNFEAQMIAGTLKASTFPGVDTSAYPQLKPLVKTKPVDERYISGLMFSYNPKWFPGLFIGFGRSFYLYADDLGGRLDDLLPFLAPLSKKDALKEDSKRRDQLTAVYFRWLWREAKAEIYGELGRNDHSGTFRDLLLEPDHSRAYLAGVGKMIRLSNAENSFLKVSIEVAQLARTNTRFLRDTPEWYLHGQVADGYTNRGELIGAGIGPGSAFKTIDLSWVRDYQRFGLTIDVLNYNQDLSRILPESQGFRGWTDRTVTLHADKRIKDLLIGAGVTGISSANYLWKQDADLFSIVARVGLTYRFN